MSGGPSCKYCGATNVIRYGLKKGVQRWWCKSCHRKFVDNDALPGMRVAKAPIAFAVNEFYDGSTIKDICLSLQARFSIYPSESTIYRWITRFSGMATDKTRGVVVSVGAQWEIAETRVECKARSYQLLGIMDKSTRFLLSTRISAVLEPKDITQALESAAVIAGRRPEVVSPQQDSEYLDACAGLLHELSSQNTMLKVLEGCTFHYNYLKPQEELGGFSPSRRANAQVEYQDWYDFVCKSYV